jgi:hypothetical protein
MIKTYSLYEAATGRFTGKGLAYLLYQYRRLKQLGFEKSRAY